MKIYSVVIFRCFYDKTGVAAKSPILVSAHYELSSFGYFQRGSVKEVALFVSREVNLVDACINLKVIGRSQPGQKQSIQHKEHFCHSFVTINNVGAAALTDGEYPARVAYGYLPSWYLHFSLLQKCIDEFMNAYGAKFDSLNSDTELVVEKIDKMLLDYQDPSKADPTMRIQKVYFVLYFLICRTLMKRRKFSLNP